MFPFEITRVSNQYILYSEGYLHIDFLYYILLCIYILIDIISCSLVTLFN